MREYREAGWTPQEYSLMGNHYSPKYERCFILTSFRDGNYWSRNLVDAYEDNEWASEELDNNNSKVSKQCIIGHPPDSDSFFALLSKTSESQACAIVHAYIDEHMSN